MTDTDPERAVDDFSLHGADLEAEDENFWIHQEQIEEKREREDNERAWEEYQDKLIEENALRQRGKLRQEYLDEQEAIRASQQVREQNRIVHLERLAELERKAEEDRSKTKFARVRFNLENEAKNKQGSLPKISPSRKEEEEAMGRKGRNRESPTRSDRDWSRNSEIESRRRQLERERYDYDHSDEVLAFAQKDGKRRRIPPNKVDDFGLHLGKSKRRPETPVSFDYGEDRRRKIRAPPTRRKSEPMPSRRKDQGHVSDRESRSRKNREYPDKRSKKREVGKLGPPTPPLPPIGSHHNRYYRDESFESEDDEEEPRMHMPRGGRHSPNARRDDYSPPNQRRHKSPAYKSNKRDNFDWAIHLKPTEEEEIQKVKEEREKDTEDFSSKNQSIFSQFSALKNRLKNSEDANSDKERDEEKDNKGSRRNKNRNEDEIEDADKLTPEEFKRKIDINSGNKIDFDATNKTVIRSFLKGLSK